MTDSSHETFGEVRARLDEIVAEVRSKDTSLEKSLDLFEEAIKLGNRCAELVDKPDYTPEEAALAAEAMSAAEQGEAEGDKSASDPEELATDVEETEADVEEPEATEEQDRD